MTSKSTKPLIQDGQKSKYNTGNVSFLYSRPLQIYTSLLLKRKLFTYIDRVKFSLSLSAGADIRGVDGPGYI